MTKEGAIALGRSGIQGGLKGAEAITSTLVTNVVMSWKGSS